MANEAVDPRDLARVDVRKLLSKFLHYLRDVEGCDFVWPIEMRCDTELVFTEAEWAMLQQAHDEGVGPHDSVSPQKQATKDEDASKLCHYEYEPHGPLGGSLYARYKTKLDSIAVCMGGYEGEGNAFSIQYYTPEQLARLIMFSVRSDVFGGRTS